ncbi:hypothetical protein M2323_004560 [Rhodoblastus acidophilus]|uniref:DUF1254 domain-containing protein n=1 Tax=Rhodoblastus acidophilus TaxID=1074 RepID=UPI0022245EE4|nr:DUF1254 domain-containing protein [Rhodoblastus acidophilus]MCW2286771.1 hypothetical protein [Rhodoblastus acidophilus]MCW2335609.1 hypothetical protein [Rhodoblastus acidophilus]
MNVRALTLTATIAALLTVPALRASAQDTKPDWREMNAYALGVQAYIYTFPWSYMTDQRWFRSADVGHQANQLFHFRDLKDASHVDGGSPNNDTLYSRSWLYLKEEPIILSVPAISDRYHSVELTDYMDDNFAYVGTRATGDGAGTFAIVGPGWKGSLPAGVTALPSASTPWAFLQVRTAVKDASDLDAAHAIQDKYKLTPLSQWENPAAPPPKSGEIWRPLDRAADPLNEWRTINRSMLEVAADPRDADMLQSFARIGVGPGLDIDKLDASTKRGLARAAVDGRTIINSAFADGYRQTNVNGWNYPPPETGRMTQTRDWLLRAIQPAAGFNANDPIEAVYLNVSVDGEGKKLSGANRYVIHFDKGAEPKVKAFWSLTMYNLKYNLVANPINRYSLGDRSGMKRDADGGLTIYIQKDAPGADRESNWLPAPDGPFFLFLRTYLPGDDILNQTWQPPKISRIE